MLQSRSLFPATIASKLCAFLSSICVCSSMMYFSLLSFKPLNLSVRSAIYYLSSYPSIILYFNSSQSTIMSRVLCIRSNCVISVFFSMSKLSPSISADLLILLGSSNYILIDTFSSFICFSLFFNTVTSMFLISSCF